VKSSYIVLIVGAVMLLVGNFLGNALLNSIFTNNPNHSHLINDVNQDLLSLSNSLLIMSKLGIAVLVLGGIIFFKDRIKSTK
jgi:drug/metabolite transporter (DMT)-like permease